MLLVMFQTVLLHVIFTFSRINCWKYSPSSNSRLNYLGTFARKSFDHMFKSLFLKSIFYSIGQYICLYASNTMFWLLKLGVSFEIKKCECSIFVLFFYLIYLLAVLGLYCCIWGLSRVSSSRDCSSCSMRASHCAGFSHCRTWTQGPRASVVVTCGFSSCGAWA